MSWRKGLVLGCLGLFLLCGGGGAGLVYFLYQSFRGPTEAADRFLTLIGEDKSHDAYDMTADGFRKGLDEPAFASGLKPTGLGEYSAVSWSSWSSENGITTIEGAVTTRKATTIPVTLKLLKEDGRWKVLGMTPAPVAQVVNRGTEPAVAQVSDKQRRIDRAHSAAVRCVAFSPDGRRILSGGGEAVRLWDAESCEMIAQFDGHTADVCAVAFAPDGQRILSASQDQTVRIWDIENRKALKTLTVLANPAGTVAFSADGRLALVGGLADRTPGLWDVQAGKHPRSFDGTHVSGVYSLAFSPDGKGALSGGFDRGGVRVWDVATGKELSRFRLDPGATEASTYAVAFSPDGKRALLSGGVTPSPSLWEVDGGKRLRLFKTAAEATRSVAFSPDGRRIVAGSNEGPVRVFDADTGRELALMKGHIAGVFAVAFSPDGRLVASGGADQSVRLWKLTGEASSAREPVGGE